MKLENGIIPVLCTENRMPNQRKNFWLVQKWGCVSTSMSVKIQILVSTEDRDVEPNYRLGRKFRKGLPTESRTIMQVNNVFRYEISN